MEEQDSKNKLEKFKIALDFLKFEATMNWQMFNAFLIGNNIFIVVIATIYSKNHSNYPLFLTIGIIGSIISAMWFITFRRNTDWYKFRMKQAKDAESEFVNIYKDDKWYLLNREAKDFAEGHKIKGLNNRTTGYGLILTYFIVYLILIFYSLFQICFQC